RRRQRQQDERQLRRGVRALLEDPPDMRQHDQTEHGAGREDVSSHRESLLGFGFRPGRRRPRVYSPNSIGFSPAALSFALSAARSAVVNRAHVATMESTIGVSLARP